MKRSECKPKLDHDLRDQTNSITAPKALETSYTVDGLGNVSEIDSPDTGVETRTYDAAGNVITRTDARSKVSTYAYDALNRLIRITFSDDTSPITYRYDSGPNAALKRVGMDDASGHTAWT